jgi:hypothetical protein
MCSPCLVRFAKVDACLADYLDAIETEDGKSDEPSRDLRIRVRAACLRLSAFVRVFLRAPVRRCFRVRALLGHGWSFGVPHRTLSAPLTVCLQVAVAFNEVGTQLYTAGQHHEVHLL